MMSSPPDLEEHRLLATEAVQVEDGLDGEGYVIVEADELEVSTTHYDADLAFAIALQDALHDADFDQDDDSVRALQLQSCTSFVAIALSWSEPTPRGDVYSHEGTRIGPLRPEDSPGRYFFDLAAQLALRCAPGHVSAISSTSIWIEVGLDSVDVLSPTDAVEARWRPWVWRPIIDTEDSALYGRGTYVAVGSRLPRHYANGASSVVFARCDCGRHLYSNDGHLGDVQPRGQGVPADFDSWTPHDDACADLLVVRSRSRLKDVLLLHFKEILWTETGIVGGKVAANNRNSNNCDFCGDTATLHGVCCTCGGRHMKPRNQ